MKILQFTHNKVAKFDLDIIPSSINDFLKCLETIGEVKSIDTAQQIYAFTPLPGKTIFSLIQT